MISYRNIDNQWLIESPAALQPGTEVTVTKKNGTTKIERVGELMGSNGYGFRYAIAARAVSAPVKSATLGSLSGILALFDRAKKHLKYPAIVLGVEGGRLIRIGVAGSRAKFPGSLTIVDGDRPDDYEERREWFGRVFLNGVLSLKPEISGSPFGSRITEKLRAFAIDPARVAAEHGRLTGRCCFCNRALSDERSTAVGYGETCAGHYGLPWGEARTDFVAEAAPATRNSEPGSIDWANEEAERERAETIRDERNKHDARTLMELAASFPVQS